jgi:hypothetical protein
MDDTPTNAMKKTNLFIVASVAPEFGLIPMREQAV